jgi:hypothetical protein
VALRGARRLDQFSRPTKREERTGVMAHNTKQEIWNGLQKEIQNPSFQRKFNRLKKKHSKLAGFDTPQELINYFNPPNPFNPCTRDRLACFLVSHYRKTPRRKGWLMSLLLVILWKQMECTFYRFGYATLRFSTRETLNLVNPFDSFAPVYESYIDAFFSVSIKKSKRFILHLKDRAEHLIKQELKECGRFSASLNSCSNGNDDSAQEIPAPENLPWQFEIEQMIEEWTSKSIVSNQEAKLVIDHLVYEFTFKELSNRQNVPYELIRKRFQRALKKLKPYLRGKYFLKEDKLTRK